MLKKYLKILFIILVISTSSQIFAEDISQEKKVEDAILFHKKSMNDEMKLYYENFKGLVKNKINFNNLALGCTFFNENNTNLIIGSSGVVYCGFTMWQDGLLKYGYDVIGYGGIFESDVCDLLSRLEDKKYNNIVLFGGVNDLNVRAVNGIKDIDLLYCTELHKFVTEAKKHLFNESSKIVYVKIKPMIFGRDGDDKAFIECYNNMANEINNNIESFGFIPYTILFETTSEYSAKYIHYNNRVVFEKMFDDINNNNFH